MSRRACCIRPGPSRKSARSSAASAVCSCCCTARAAAPRSITPRPGATSRPSCARWRTCPRSIRTTPPSWRCIPRRHSPPPSEVEELRKRFADLDLPEAAKKEVDRELERLERANRDSMEAQVIRTYLETMAELPWNKRAEESLDLKRAAEILEQDHHGLKDVKDQVLECLAVRELRQRSP